MTDLLPELPWSMNKWFDELEDCSLPSMPEAATEAAPLDTGMWELPSGHFVTLQLGPPVPEGSVLVGKRKNDRWVDNHGLPI